MEHTRRYPLRERKPTQFFTFPPDHRCNDDDESHDSNPFGDSDDSSLSISENDDAGSDDSEFVIDDSSTTCSSSDSFHPSSSSDCSEVDDDIQSDVN